MGRRRRRRAPRIGRAFALLLLLVAVAAGAYVVAEREDAPPPRAASGALRVAYIDVGQGDAVVWELPDGSVVLYDCGPPVADADTNQVVRHLRALGLAEGARIHALVSSHGHLDHVGGCDEVFEQYEVAHVIEAWYEGDDAPRSYQRFLDLARGEGAALHTLADLAQAPRVAMPEAAQAAGIVAEVLWPSALPDAWDRIAEASVVVRLVHGEVAFCFQGDIEREQERIIAQGPGERECDVHLVGHHGSRHASDSVWLSVMDPELAIVSSGPNPYGHPTSEALCRVQASGAQVLATARGGTVVVESDGASWRVVRGGPAETADYCAPGASFS